MTHKEKPSQPVGQREGMRPIPQHGERDMSTLTEAPDETSMYMTATA